MLVLYKKDIKEQELDDDGDVYENDDDENDVNENNNDDYDASEWACAILLMVFVIENRTKSIKNHIKNEIYATNTTTYIKIYMY